ncbi:unnamed protein product [Blepharisma stoltei]|uniref:C2H2-type domain-containing protein n=1 Tax=Blepharisma stoltei TaxID=1481888 RepID=A0AAU9IVW9_9CILI|nr:unnamed protein product [Blepharisma stoltei]
MDWVINEWFIVEENREAKTTAKESSIAYQCIVKGCSHKVKTLKRLCHHLKKHFFKCPEDNGKFKCFCKLIRHIQKEHLVCQVSTNQDQTSNSNKEEVIQESLTSLKPIEDEIDNNKMPNIAIPINFSDEIPKKRQNSIDNDQGATKKNFHSALKPFKKSEAVYKDTWKSCTNDFSSAPDYGVRNLSKLDGSNNKEIFEKKYYEGNKKDLPSEVMLVKPEIPQKKSVKHEKDHKKPSTASKNSNNTVRCALNPFTARVAKKSAAKFEDIPMIPSHNSLQKRQFNDDHARRVFK